jgi:hypothetical protein
MEKEVCLGKYGEKAPLGRYKVGERIILKCTCGTPNLLLNGNRRFIT